MVRSSVAAFTFAVAPGGQAELFFVSIRPGDYIWCSSGIEHKGFSGKLSVT